MFKKIKDWYRSLPDKKKYVEFITALLTVPVLLTILITNLNNLNNNKKTETTPTLPPPKEKIVVVTGSAGSPSTSSTPTLPPTTSQCKKEVGPVKITKPDEDQLVDDEPVCLQISYQVGEYCSVVYAYSINNGDWSDYTDKEICLYNLTAGPQTLELRVKSSQSDDEVTLIRNFYYKSKESPTPNPSPTP